MTFPRFARATTVAAAAVASLFTGVVATTAGASAPPAGTGAAESGADPSVSVTTVVDLRAVDLAWRADDPALYLVQQDGVIQQLVDGVATPVLDVSDLVARDGGEQGLLGLAFSPSGDHAYINFTDAGGDTVVAELTVSDDGTAFDRDAMRTVLTIDQPYANHNGGDLAFGPDGLLYIPTGDGGDGGDPERRAQNPEELLGKLLRIDPAPSGELGYTIPADNPYVDVEGTRGEIWSFGLRNPWRVSFDPDTGDLWIADVGQNTTEEVNVAPAADGVDAAKGLNFGWNAFEGNDVFEADVVVDDHWAPIYTYDHASGGCSISGGVRARGEGAGTLAGWYVFGDYCSGVVSALEVTGDGDTLAAGRTVELTTTQKLTAVVAGPDGTVYLLSSDGVLALAAA